jgi:hypothetical protein
MSRVLARRWRIAVGAWLVTIAIASDGFGAQAGVVAVVRPPEPGPMTTEVVTRVRGELVAAGFQVALVDHAPGADPAVEMRQVAARLRPLAIFGIFEQTEGADVWVADLMTGKTLVQRIGADAQERAVAKDGSSVQAVRAVELLRASLLELVVERSNLANAPRPPERDAPAEGPGRVCPCDVPFPAPKTGSIDFEAGAALLHSFEGIGPSVSPIVRVSYQPWSRFAVRVAAAGLGTRAAIERASGQARVAQQLALLELAALFDADRTLVPTLSIGAGAYHLQAEGSAPAPYLATTEELWAAAFEAGGGGRLALGRHFALSLEVHAILTSLYPMVRIAETDAGRAGRPSLLGSLTLAATP